MADKNLSGIEKALLDDLKAIFKVKQISYSLASSLKEQNKLFIKVDQANNTVKDAKHLCRVEGSASMFATLDKLPLGFYSKMIKQADKDLTKKFFFSEIEANTQTFGNIVERGFNFVYFYSAQYDPEQGTITSVDIEIDTEEN